MLRMHVAIARRNAPDRFRSRAKLDLRCPRSPSVCPPFPSSPYKIKIAKAPASFTALLQLTDPATNPARY